MIALAHHTNGRFFHLTPSILIQKLRWCTELACRHVILATMTTTVMRAAVLLQACFLVWSVYHLAEASLGACGVAQTATVYGGVRLADVRSANDGENDERTHSARK